MVSNTQRIEALERRVGELDGLDERVRDLGSVRLEPETTNALNAWLGWSRIRPIC